MKMQADRKCTFRTFHVDDMVFLKLQLYLQTSVATCAYHKLAFRYYGPDHVIWHVNDVSYEL